MNKFEYIKWFSDYIDDDTPVIFIYEVDLENERYATRMIEVYYDKSMKPVIEEGFDFITEEPIPLVEEINMEDCFYAEIISKEEFEELYKSNIYNDDISFKKS